MRLSEAIRLGALLKPQAFGPSGWKGSCALRAASEAVGILQPVHDLFLYTALALRFPILRHHDVACPSCGHQDDLMFTTYHLNDEHRWTREAIADFVETVERSREDVAVGRDQRCEVSLVDASHPVEIA
jgi:hypothetical protein